MFRPETTVFATYAPAKTALTAAQAAEAEMIHEVYDRASTNDGACRVAEVARGLCTRHEDDAYADNREFDREAYMDIVLRTLRSKRGY